MYNPIKNLGDYNAVRIDLQAVNGCKSKLYKQIGNNAVRQAAPRIFNNGMFWGSVITISVVNLALIITTECLLYKERKIAKANAAVLTKKLKYYSDIQLNKNIENDNVCESCGCCLDGISYEDLYMTEEEVKNKES